MEVFPFNKRKMKALTLLLTLSAIARLLTAQTDSIDVYVVLSEECPICNYMGPILSETANSFADLPVRFFTVFPSKRSSEESMKRFQDLYDLNGFQMLPDTDQAITKKLGASVTPEVVILNQNEEILYRGRINDAYSKPGRRKVSMPSNELDRNIRNALYGVEIDRPWAVAIGCYITFHREN